MRLPGGPALSVAAAVLLVAGLASTGCSATPPPEPTDGPPLQLGADGACGLAPEMDRLVGRPSISEPGGFTVGQLYRCTWVYGRDPSRYISLTAGAAGAHAASIDSFGDGEQVAGLGDDARWWPGVRAISVARRGVSFQLNLELDEPDATRQLAEDIARQVLEQLP